MNNETPIIELTNEMITEQQERCLEDLNKEYLALLVFMWRETDLLFYLEPEIAQANPASAAVVRRIRELVEG